MKIAFDISAQAIQKSGVGYYQYRLLKAMTEKYPHFAFTLYGFNWRNYKNFQSVISGQWSVVSLQVFKIPHRLILFLWIFFRLPSVNFFIGDHNIYQLSELSISPIKKGKSVAFVHDLTTILFPDYHTKSNIFIHQKRFENLNKADAVLVNSHCTKKDVIKHLKINPAKIHVTYLAADEKFKPLHKSEAEPILKKYNIQTPYLLFTGTLEPRKNIQMLIEVFNTLKKQFKIPHQLVLAGKKGWKYESIFQAIQSSDNADDILHLGYVEESDLPGIMNGAEVFVYPSFYEGFGLPVLEAMQCGTPVLTSNISALPEVGGEACLYADPYQKDEWIRALFRLIQDETLRQHLAEKGIAHARNFSWKKCAEETMAVYLSVVSD